jgi:hypothetical protein
MKYSSPQNIRKFLFAVQILTAFFAVLMVIAGLFVSKTVKGPKQDLTRSSEIRLDEKLRPSIGSSYSEDKHYKLLELMRAGDEVNTSLIKALVASAEVMCMFGGIFAISSLMSIFLLLRKPSVPTNPLPPPDPGK